MPKSSPEKAAHTAAFCGGFSYEVSNEQLAAFQALSPLERLQWVEAARQFTLLGQTEITRKRHENLRKGLSITG